MNVSRIDTQGHAERHPDRGPGSFAARIGSHGRALGRLLSLVSVLFAAAPAAGQSTLADTDDVLDGSRYLVRADDLLVADPSPATASSTEVRYFELLTEDMVITSEELVAPMPVVEPPCSADPAESTPFPQVTQAMRLYDLPYDMIVTLAPSANAGGANCASGQAGNMTFTVDDPKTWTRPFTVELPLRRDDNYGMFEYACHEGNYSLFNILSGARADEAAAAAAVAK